LAKKTSDPYSNKTISMHNDIMRGMGPKKHAVASLPELLIFRIASRYSPALEGLARGFVAREMERESYAQQGKGIEPLLVASAKRLHAKERGQEKWSYTKKHSLDVACLSYMIASEARKNGLAGAEALDPKLCFAGGYVHDIGKTFLPLAIVVKELGARIWIFELMQGGRLSEAEKKVLRNEHLSTGTTFVRMYKDGVPMNAINDMVGLHHVNYNGIGTTHPSYPTLFRGCELPLCSRIAKTADFISAVMPRHYRTRSFVNSLDDALAYAITVSGKELDPMAVSCLISSMHDVGFKQVSDLVSRLSVGCSQEGISRFRSIKGHISENIESNMEFRQVVMKKSHEKIRQYMDEIRKCARELGLFIPDVSLPY